MSTAPFESPATSSLELLRKATQRPSDEIEQSTQYPATCAPAELTLTLVVVPATMSRAYTSKVPFVSPATRAASVAKTTVRPSPELDTSATALPFGWPTLTSSVVFVSVSRRKTSSPWFVSPAARFDARLENATKRPSDEIAGRPLPTSSFPWTPAEFRLTMDVVPVRRSRTKQSVKPTSPGTRSEASLKKATYLPSAEIAAA
jgi:hypothetical protein